MAVRDKINQGEIAGSRIFCAGWIVGLDGPYSEDFLGKAREMVSPAMVKRINSIWVENVGRHLMWLTPDQVASEVRAYIGKGIDFVKYASNDHAAGAFLAFSPSVQAAIVGEAHRVRITAQAHTLSVEGLKIAIEAGCDLIQHANLTGPTPIPEETLELCAKRQTGAVIFPLTARGLEWFGRKASEQARTMWAASDVNARNLIRSGARLLLANDGAVFSPETLTEASFAEFWAELSGDAGGGLYNLSQGHFGWFKAMEEKGCPPMDMLRAATRNIAEAYGKGKDLGTIEVGKVADMLILDKNPLTAAENYRSIQHVIKEGVVVDRERLPRHPILTKALEPPAPEEACYVPFLRPPREFPMCPACMRR
jgi:imidazolonepropionase-like amidohydrolase